MAICDSQYKFIYTDIGARGRNNDSGVFNACNFKAAMDNGELNIPQPAPLTARREKAVPYFLLGDDAFTMDETLLKPCTGTNLPYEDRIFNYRHCRTRRCIENAFGIMSARFRVLRKHFEVDNTKACDIVAACVVLHNFLMSRSKTYAPPTFVDRDVDGAYVPGDWRQDYAEDILDSKTGQCGRLNTLAKAIRGEIADYFLFEGEVDFMYDHVF